jgi:hypothetical protein
MGINVEATRIKLFTMMGVIAAFAALLLTIEINVFYPTQGQGFLLPTMAAVFIGGTSIAGGQGVIVGTFFGAYIIGSLEAGVVASGIGVLGSVGGGPRHGRLVILNVTIGEGNIAILPARIAAGRAGSLEHDRRGVEGRRGIDMIVQLGPDLGASYRALIVSLSESGAQGLETRLGRCEAEKGGEA